MGIEEKLESINSTKEAIKQKIRDKGVELSDLTPFKDYPNYIQRIEAQSVVQESEEWTPDPLWWDIETILANDTNPDNPELDNCKKAIFLIDPDIEPTISVKVTNTAVLGLKTSDGGLYIATSSSVVTKTHTWDTTQAKQSSLPERKTMYCIIYYAGTGSMTFSDITINSALYMISQIGIYNSQGSNSSHGNIGGNYLQGLKLLEGSGLSSKSGYRNRCVGSQRLVYLDFKCTINSSCWTAQFNYWGNLTYWKVHPENISGTDETTGLKHYNLPEAVDKLLNVLDVSEIDFSQAHSDIYTDLACRNIKGIIDLSGNTLNTSFTLFKATTNPISFSLILPSNADVKINQAYVTAETAKFLIENAPTIEEAHTLTISNTLYRYLKRLPHTHSVLYNGEQYSDGVQVLTLKGWTVTGV